MRRIPAAPARHKYWCEPCDVVAKNRPIAGTPGCPHCGESMRAMGRIWKPGPKGNRMKHYPEGWGTPLSVRMGWPTWRTGEKLKRGGKILSVRKP